MWKHRAGNPADGIRISLTEPEKIRENTSRRRRTPVETATAEAQGSPKLNSKILNPTRPVHPERSRLRRHPHDYHNVAAELASAEMNYEYTVEFLEIDPLSLGLEKMGVDDKAPRRTSRSPSEPDKKPLPRDARNRGSQPVSHPQGNDQTSAVCYDGSWAEERNLQTEAGKTRGRHLAFMERITREVRRGGRTTLIVELVVPNLPPEQ